MSHRGRRSRPLGSIRASLTGIESIPKLPPLNTGSSIDSSYVGIHGNSLGTPLSRGSPERSEREVIEKPKPAPIKGPSRNTSSSRSEGSKSDDSAAAAAAAALKKELKEAQVREKELLAEIDNLKKIITGLEKDIREKVKVNEELDQELKALKATESRYKELYESEVRLHNGTKDNLSSTKNLLSAKERQIDDLKDHQQKEIAEINATMKKKLEDLEKAKNAEIAAMDVKLKRLKSQMADALQGNSWERQQQLDELSKELSRATEETEMLRAKLRAMAKNGAKQGNPGCANCESLSARVQHLDRTITEKDKSLRELKLICSKFEKQLNQKDILNQISSERKMLK